MIERTFFEREPQVCAYDLIGMELRWGACAGRIVETEAYSAVGDEASHIFMRPSARAFVAKHLPGTAYVYLNYGMHWLLNVLVKGGTEDGFVLFRALQPTQGLELMRERRRMQEERSLCSGPGKLAQALGVGRQHHGLDIFQAETVSLVPPKKPVAVIEDIRIGITRSAHLRWRYIEAGSRFVSVRPTKEARPASRPGFQRSRGSYLA